MHNGLWPPRDPHDQRRRHSAPLCVLPVLRQDLAIFVFFLLSPSPNVVVHDDIPLFGALCFAFFSFADHHTHPPVRLHTATTTQPEGQKSAARRAEDGTGGEAHRETRILSKKSYRGDLRSRSRGGQRRVVMNCNSFILFPPPPLFFLLFFIAYYFHLLLTLRWSCLCRPSLRSFLAVLPHFCPLSLVFWGALARSSRRSLRFAPLPRTGAMRGGRRGEREWTEGRRRVKQGEGEWRKIRKPQHVPGTGLGWIGFTAW